MPTQSSEFNNPEISPSKIIGASLPRIDGPLKTTGSARYASDYNFANMVYAVPVCATIANGKIRSLDTRAAEKMPGVLLVLHHDNIGPLFRFFGQGRNSEGRPPLEDNVISYWGQYVALVVAETLQQAEAAAAAVQVQYDAEPPNVSTELENETETTHTESKRGDPDSAFASAPVQLDELYGTPAETHNPME
ncbi:MAG: xanthine dehydrogenase family protein molybdopterin-binding subunit, partial [Acidobacteriaceae bacterium]